MPPAAQTLRNDFPPHGGEMASQSAASAGPGLADIVHLQPTSAMLRKPAPGAVLQASAAPVAARLASPLWRWFRSNAFSWLLGALSIGSVLLFWYLATKYKLDLYVRFINIPSPGEVLDKVFEVNRSAKFINNVGISVRRILLGFFVATGFGVEIGRAHV